MNDKSTAFTNWSAVDCFLFYFRILLRFVTSPKPTGFDFGKDRNSRSYLPINGFLLKPCQDNREFQREFKQVQVCRKHYYRALSPSQ